ncbi:DUF6185 family protein [Saccharothrix sp. ST-888]|uniref:DUF6185 family protein n=1 Tax=Saccharothrix sp. ST-888 TaxID=1427391 RepID=UPI0005EC0D4F|nr:DUF6185 family protein [Saccharothrix sp. ST-888]KJK57679.1 hypothetical protein UK12_14945 [Saccharothrix sp. ST-888]
MRRDARALVHRWRRCTALLLVGLAWWALWPGRAEAAADGCHAEQLVTARTEAVLRLVNHAQTVIEGKGDMTVQVPTTWALANDLMLSESSDAYRLAMRCLLREEQGSPRFQDLRTDEWRPHRPQVTAEDSWVKVQYQTVFWFDQRGTFTVGPWAVDMHAERWKLSLTPPTALAGARWDRVQIDLGGLDAFEVAPTPTAVDSENLVWSGLGQPGGPSTAVTVQLVPPWQRALATANTSRGWRVVNAAGLAAWWAGTSAVIVVAAVRARRQPAGAVATPVERSSSGALLRWGLLNAVVGVMILLLYLLIPDAAKAVGEPGPWGDERRWQVLIGVLTGWALTVTARPRASVLLAASLTAVAGTLVAVLPGLFGLPPTLVPQQPPPASGIAALVLLTAAMLWLWLTGLVLWVRLIASDGGLLREPANPLRLRGTGAALAALTVLLLGWALWAREGYWERISWLTDRTAPAYGSLHLLVLSQQAASLAASVPAWCFSHAWVLTGVAIVALLRARGTGLPVPYANPAELDRLLLAVFFAVVVAWREGSYAGSQVLASLWLVLDIAALYGLLAVGQRWAVLNQHLEGCAAAPTLGEAIAEAGHRDLIERARRYRELTTVLRGLDQGHGEGALGRHAVEKELNRLHRWRQVAQGAVARPWLPSQVTVVDIALSWGPHARWWDNARRAALLAAAVGVPGSVILVWSAYAPQEQWMLTRQNLFGVPDLVWRFASWELVWAGAGLVMGALWRLLPGRRGPARALWLVAAYSMLIALDIMGNLITDQTLGAVALAICLMLLVLTLTSLAMDADTFRAERRFWPSRFELLLSIYQLRGLSVQIAYVMAQLAVVISIWKFLAGPDLRSMKP